MGRSHFLTGIGRSFAIGTVLLAAAACAAKDPAVDATTVTAEASTVTVTAAPAATAPAPAPIVPTSTPSALASSIRDGVYVVGEDVAPGTYRSDGPTEVGLCNWSFLPSVGANIMESTDNHTITGPGYMELADGDIVYIIGCQQWTLDS